MIQARTNRSTLAVLLGCAAALASMLLFLPASGAEEGPPPGSAELKAELRAVIEPAAAPTRHLAGLSPEQVRARAAQARSRQELLREKLEDKWFAALVELEGPEPFALGRRFKNWNEWDDFVRTNRALVEVWSDPGGGPGHARRLTALEQALLQQQPTDQPTRVTVTFRDPVSRQIRSYGVEFGFDAADRALTALRAAKGTAPAADPVVAALHLAGAGGEGAGLSIAPDLRERALAEGGLVEQVLPGQSDMPVLADQLLPQVHFGAQAVEERYTEVLGDLLEWRHYLRKRELGLPMDTAELLQAAGALEDLAGKGIWIDDGDALVTVDRFTGSFVYRRYVQGQARLVKVTGIPSRTDLVRDTAKAEAARRMELRERAALSPRGHGIALVHRVDEVNGRPEVGPLILSEGRPEGIASLQALLDKLPAADRARLRFQGFWRTMIDADFEGTGRRDRFFLTLQFPVGEVVRRERVNPLTGEREVLVEKDGLLIQLITDTRMTEFDYSPEREETATRTYLNTGSRAAPAKGTFLEETRTLETWQRDWSLPDIDPYLPTIAKSKVNHVTGETTREIYGLFPEPVATVDDQFITFRQFNPYGVLASAAQFENGRGAPDFERPLRARLHDPVVGRERFQWSSPLTANELERLRDLASQGYVTTLLCRDRIKGVSRTQVFDRRHGGRKVSESFTDRLGGTNVVPVKVSFEYRPDFYFGQVPVRITERSGVSDRLLSRTEIRSYDPFLRRRVGVTLDYTGRVVTNVWEHDWIGPIETQTTGRKTIQLFNHDGTQVTGTTTLAASGEEVSRFHGRFDARSQQWQTERVTWFRPGVTNDSQTLTMSEAGRVLSVRSGGTLERRPVYGPDGVEQAVEVFGRNPASGQFNRLLQREDDYQWQGGERNARIQRYAEGQLCDSFRRLSDVEGRVRLDEVRDWPGLSLKTEVAYEGWSERPVRAQTLQNGQVRWTRLWLEEERKNDGSSLLTVKTVPHWGLALTQTYQAGDPLKRPMTSRFENGDSLHVRQWFEGTALPKIYELRDRHDHPNERFTRRLNAGMEGPIPYDLETRQKLSLWGVAATVEEKALVRGTDLLLFRATPDERVYFDLAQPFEAPAYAIDPRGQSGTQFMHRGQAKEHVVAVYRARMENQATAGLNRQDGEPILGLDSIDLRRWPPTDAARRIVDRAGHVLSERFLNLPALEGADRSEALFAALDRATVRERYHYRYQPGWFVERRSPDDEGRTWSFSHRRPGGETPSFAVNDGSRREWVTEILGIRATPEVGRASALRQYFFRRFHDPAMKERNPFLPGCSNVWTSWIATELAPDETKLLDSELIYDAQERLRASRAARSTGRGEPKVTIAYGLTEPEPQTWRTFELKSGTNSLALDLAGAEELGGCEFLYFHLQQTNRAAWSVEFRSDSGREVYLNPAATAVRKGEVPPTPVLALDSRAWLNRIASQDQPFVSAPRPGVAGEVVVAVSVEDLTRAGLDGARLSSATLRVQGSPGAVVKVSPVARLVRAARR